jgi:hypothetical protein
VKLGWDAEAVAPTDRTVRGMKGRERDREREGKRVRWVTALCKGRMGGYQEDTAWEKGSAVDAEWWASGAPSGEEDKKRRREMFPWKRW